MPTVVRVCQRSNCVNDHIVARSATTKNKNGEKSATSAAWRRFGANLDKVEYQRLYTNDQVVVSDEKSNKAECQRLYTNDQTVSAVTT